MIGTSIPKVAAPITVSTAAKINTFFMPAPKLELMLRMGDAMVVAATPVNWRTNWIKAV